MTSRCCSWCWSVWTWPPTIYWGSGFHRTTPSEPSRSSADLLRPRWVYPTIDRHLKLGISCREHFVSVLTKFKGAFVCVFQFDRQGSKKLMTEQQRWDWRIKTLLLNCLAWSLILISAVIGNLNDIIYSIMFQYVLNIEHRISA